MTATCIMVLGTTSGAGKSWLCTALCRYYARLGLRVAPFKAQNMSNNARVVPGPGGRWGEIGSAQYFQALAAQMAPDVRMNPLLLKPESDTHSQVVWMGQVDPALSALPWHARSEAVWPGLTESLDSLRDAVDVVVIEGAGSPAEINLQASDVVNLRIARHAQARCLLITDIDRGGAFAHLYGTWALLPPSDRALIEGFVLNRFRGDPALLSPGPAQLEALTGVPTVATLPMWRGHGLPEEDGMLDERSAAGGAVHTTVALIAWPHLSNLDEFQILRQLPGLRLIWARTPADCAGADWILLPGSKNTPQDLAWLRRQGLDAAIVAHARAGRRVLGICGGLQVLGEALVDGHHLEGNAPGLGLLPLVTRFEPDKILRSTHSQFAPIQGPWSALSGVAVSGYEIHQGRTAETLVHAHTALSEREGAALEVLPGLGWLHPQGHVLGIYLHGLFENASVVRALWGAPTRTLDAVFDGLADFLAQHVPEPTLKDWLRPRPQG